MDIKNLVPMEVQNINNVRCYLDENGTAWLNAEDVARGLGFVDVHQKKDFATSGEKYETVRWARVNQYLAEFGFSKEVGKEDYLPENMFYRLAMKAKNAVAEKFQAKVADEILPAIRKTGEYKVNKASVASVQKELDEIILSVGRVREAIQKVYGVKDGIALAQATNLTGTFYKFNLSELKALIPPAEHETGYMNATQLGEKVGKTARAVNQFLKEKGLQYREGKNWRLTEKGKQYAEEIPYDTGKHSGYQIRWSLSVAELFPETR